MNILTRAMTTLSAGIVSSAQSGHENTEIGDHSGFLRGATQDSHVDPLACETIASCDTVEIRQLNLPSCRCAYASLI